MSCEVSGRSHMERGGQTLHDLLGKGRYTGALGHVASGEDPEEIGALANHWNVITRIEGM